MVWKELEARLSAMGGKELRTELTELVAYVLDNLGQPSEYLKNPEESKLNTRIEEILDIHKVIFAPGNMKLVAQLFEECSGKKRESNECAFRLFYNGLWDNLAIWYVGDELLPGNELAVGSYTRLKTKLNFASMLLDTGNKPDLDTVYNHFKKTLELPSDWSYQ